MSWKAEVQVLSTGNWDTNRLIFETEAEAEGYAGDLSRSQPGVLGWRAVETFGDVNYKWEDGTLSPVPGKTL